MFGKKKCPNCREKISETYNFCPYCRIPLSNEDDGGDWGMLGKNDSMPQEDELRLPFGFNMLFNTLVKSLNSQFNEIEKQNQKPKTAKKPSMKKGGISISISTSNGKPPEIKVSSFGNVPKFKEQEKQIKEKTNSLKLPTSNSSKFAGLPKQEPETNIRRLSNRIIYEVNLPGVKSVKDVSIAQFENSIEIKALAKNKVFSKIIPINLPIRNYNLSKGKLTLELDSRE